MKIKGLTAFIISAATVTCLNGQEKALNAMLADTTMAGTSYSICFADAVTGEVIYGYGADRNLAPASVMKIYPTAVSLSMLGGAYRFQTEIYLSGIFNKRKGVLDGDVVIRGSGDPALGSDYFKEQYGDVTAGWVSALKAAGVRHVKGRVAAAVSIYDPNPLPDGWPWGDLGQYYGAGVYDINFNDNKYNIYVTGFSEGSPAIIDSVEEYGRDIHLTNFLTSSGDDDNGYVYCPPYSSHAWISGTVPADSSISLRASLPDPPFMLVKYLDRAMRNAGIKIKGTPNSSRVKLADGKMTPVTVTYSPTIGEIIKVTNHESVNLYAEALRKHLGYAIAGEGSFSGGSEVIENFLDSVGCEPYEAVILDGSGLSPNNNISALMTVRLLVQMYNSKDSTVFISSLPAAGVSGTMKNYFRSEVFKGRVVAKTGSIGAVRSFAGYVTVSSGRTMAFTMIANGFTAPARQITNGIERMMEEVIQTY